MGKVIHPGQQTPPKPDHPRPPPGSKPVLVPKEKPKPDKK
jgi:hypothetical protein